MINRTNHNFIFEQEQVERFGQWQERIFVVSSKEKWNPGNHLHEP